MREAWRTQHAKKYVFFIPLTTCIPLIAEKNIFDIPPFFNSQFSDKNARKLRAFFLHTNAALEVKNRVQFAWAKI